MSFYEISKHLDKEFKKIKTARINLNASEKNRTVSLWLTVDIKRKDCILYLYNKDKTLKKELDKVFAKFEKKTQQVLEKILVEAPRVTAGYMIAYPTMIELPIRFKNFDDYEFDHEKSEPKKSIPANDLKELKKLMAELEKIIFPDARTNMITANLAKKSLVRLFGKEIATQDSLADTLEGDIKAGLRFGVRGSINFGKVSESEFKFVCNDVSFKHLGVKPEYTKLTGNYLFQYLLHEVQEDLRNLAQYKGITVKRSNSNNLGDCLITLGDGGSTKTEKLEWWYATYIPKHIKQIVKIIDALDYDKKTKTFSMLKDSIFVEEVKPDSEMYGEILYTDKIYMSVKYDMQTEEAKKKIKDFITKKLKMKVDSINRETPNTLTILIKYDT